MNSFILHFRPWLLAVIALVSFETIIQNIFRPNTLEKTNFLQFAFGKPETPQRLFMFHKIKEFGESSPDIVQTGDSSGFYGIDPRIVEQHLPNGISYLNLSCCANLGFRGYYNTLKYMASKNNSVSYMVLHFTPYTMPSAETWNKDGAALWGTPEIKVFGDAIYNEFIGPWRILHLPTMAWRRPVTDWVYFRGQVDSSRPLLDNVNYTEFLRVFKQTQGWMKETDHRVSVPETECQVSAREFFDLRSMRMKTYLEEVLEAHSQLAKAHGARLVVVFQPVACVLGTGKGNVKARAALERFKRSNPDVAVPFALIESWPSHFFSVPAHVKSEYTDKIGNRLGKAMSEIIKSDKTGTQ